MVNKAPNITEKYSCHYEDPHCLTRLENAIYTNLLEMNSTFSRDIIYLCIGTDRATGDCLGPLVGSRLKALLPSASIYGTLEEPVHAVNLHEALDNIMRDADQPLVIAVDACLGNIERIGYINIKKGSLKPGSAVKKVLPEVGDFHISGVVNVGGFFEHMVLQNTRLFTVYQMADIISKSLYIAQFRYTRRSQQYAAEHLEDHA
ncbi:spore protease YyaC [Syntrophomonas palmitatica]|uniref:spore protease YyaC n=1 Tax=Syntrophomonas palmitatica TaxID=402877 RepID=UPI001FA70B50|nr:spore protease YyaC [Syntrophomonas palmitatica]